MPSSSDKQRRFFGLVRAIQKGQATGSKKVQNVANSISAQDASDFASKVKKSRHAVTKSLMTGKSGY